MVALAAFVIVYTMFNPSESGFFPRCPFRMLTGLECPGCGSQRAIHNLLNLRLGAAIGENLLLVVFIPYIIAGFVFDMLKNPSPRVVMWRKRLFGVTAIWIILTVLILFWVLRNIPFFGEWI